MDPMQESPASGAEVEDQQQRSTSSPISQDAQNVLDDIVLGFEAPFTQKAPVATKPVVPQTVQTQLKGIRRPRNIPMTQQQSVNIAPGINIHEISSDEDEYKFFRTAPAKRGAPSTAATSTPKRVPAVGVVKTKTPAARQASAVDVSHSATPVENGTAHKPQRPAVQTRTVVERVSDIPVWQSKCVEVSNFLRPGYGDLDLMKFMSLTFRTDKEREQDLTQPWPVLVASLILVIFLELTREDL